MADWVILEPPAERADRDIVFVRDNFRLLGFLVPPLWLLWHRLWLEALVAVAVLIGISVVTASGLVAPMFGWLSSLVGLFVGFEGPAMRVAGLRRRGYAETMAVTADNLDEAEIRYLGSVDDVGPEDKPAPPIPAPRAPVGTMHARHAPALGLLTYPGRR